jgi:hypothetical protein
LVFSATIEPANVVQAEGSSTVVLSWKQEKAPLNDKGLLLEKIVIGILKAFIRFPAGDGSPEVVAQEIVVEDNPNISEPAGVLVPESQPMLLLLKAARLYATVKSTDEENVAAILQPLRPHCPWPIVPIASLIILVSNIVHSDQIYL